MDTRNKIAEIISEGNKYIFYFLGIFLFIYFVIVIPYKNPVRNIPVEDAIISVGQQLDSLRRLVNIIDGQRANCLKRGQCQQDSINYFTQQIFTLNDNKIKYQKEIIELTRKETEKSFSIPILGISVTQTIIISVFPGFILIGICLSLFYRRKYFIRIQQLDEMEKEDITCPLWTFPVPYTFRGSSLLSWIAINTFGIFCHFLLIYLVLDSIFFIIKEKLGRGEFVDENIVINIFLGIIAAIFYLYTFNDLIICEWKRRRI